jgi:hypothetical protein
MADSRPGRSVAARNGAGRQGANLLGCQLPGQGFAQTLGVGAIERLSVGVHDLEHIPALVISGSHHPSGQHIELHSIQFAILFRHVELVDKSARFHGCPVDRVGDAMGEHFSQQRIGRFQVEFEGVVIDHLRAQFFDRQTTADDVLGIQNGLEQNRSARTGAGLTARRKLYNQS